jgi:6-phosphogluconate dehydrogenase
MELSAKSLQKDPGLEGIIGVAQDPGDAKWMVEDVMNKKISIPVTALSLLLRFQSQDGENFSAKMVAALGN